MTSSPEFDRLIPALDRLREAHFFLHGLEKYYHFADPFRWHLNAFLKALREVPQLISMGLQNRPGFPDWFRPQKTAINSDPLMERLGTERDFVVHQGMLKPRSKAVIGITEGRGMKLGIGIPFDPLSDSDDAMRAYVERAKDGHDFLGILAPDEDSLPCVERHWELEGFSGIDLVDLCSQAWEKMAALVNSVLGEIGVTDKIPDLTCRHSINTVRIRTYTRDDLAAGKIDGFAIRQR